MPDKTYLGVAGPRIMVHIDKAWVLRYSCRGVTDL
jgi:hypothetical protein